MTPMQVKRATIKMRIGRRFMVGDYILFANNKKARAHPLTFQFLDGGGWGFGFTLSNILW